MSDDNMKQPRRTFLKTSGAAVLGLTGLGTAESIEPRALNEHQKARHQRVGTWCASPQSPAPEGLSQEGFSEQTLRLVVRTSVGGNDLRIRLANTFRDSPVTVGAVSVGVRNEKSALMSDSVQKVTFGGLSAVDIPPHGKAYSDPVSLDVEPEQDLAVDLYIVEGSRGPTTYHNGAFKTSYIADGPHVGEPESDAFQETTESWFFLDGVDVVNSHTNGAIVTLGNSITDGYGSTVDGNNTYPHLLAERVNESNVQKSVLNAGIGGNEIIGGDPTGGKSVLARLDRDVLAQTGVSDVILLEGLNDIGHAFEDPTTTVTAEQLIAGIRQVVSRVHAQGVRIFGGTLTPYKRYTYYGKQGEETRQTVNAWIRDTGIFDGIIDFDKAIRDPNDHQRIRPEYDSGDHIHPSDAGYQAMAEAVDLHMLKK
jgi:lysophospholipase L1-like esterase